MEGESFVTPMETSERGSVPRTEEDLEDDAHRAREGTAGETSGRERAAVKLSRGPGNRSGRRREVSEAL
jgi:hypothetical protein